MKTITQYKCGVCGTVYADKKKCEACESGHKKPVKIIGRQYQAIGINASGFPDKITVAAKDGKEAMYKFIGYKTESAIEVMEEACRMGASERKSCEDAISRQAVLNTLDKMDSVLDEDRTVETYKELLIACYNDLPPVTPTHTETVTEFADRCRECGKQRWIPCSERLPKEEKKTYWICTNNGYQRECRWTNENPFWTDLTTDWRWHIADVPQYNKVVAWMPLPEPYKAGM